VTRGLLTILLALVLPGTAAAQGLGIALKGGSTGLGGDLVVGLTDKLAIKGGVGFLPFTYEGDFDGNDYTVEPPPLFGTVALDVALAGPLRIMGGLMYRSEDIVFDAQITESFDFDGTTYSETGALEGAVTSSSVAPFVGIGLGGIVGPGLGLYLDLGVAFTGDPGVEVSASGPVTQVPGFQDDLEAERANIEDDIGDYYRYWPVLNIGLKFGLGN
jgi:hypothetical protein